MFSCRSASEFSELLTVAWVKTGHYLIPSAPCLLPSSSVLLQRCYGMFWPLNKSLLTKGQRKGMTSEETTQGVTLQDSRTLPVHSLLGMNKECCKHCGASSTTRYLKVTWPEKPLLSNLVQTSEYTNCYDSGILKEKGWSLLWPQATSKVTEMLERISQSGKGQPLSQAFRYSWR